MVEAELNVQQMTASRERIRKILLDIDPHAATFRWNFPVHKFKYEVGGMYSSLHIYMLCHSCYFPLAEFMKRTKVLYREENKVN